MRNSKETKKQVKKLKPNRNLHKYLPAAILGLNIVMVLANILILSLLPRQTEEIVITRSEILAHQLQRQTAMKLAVDLQNTNQEQTKIYQSLPNKDRLLEVIKILESLKEVAQVRNFTFDSDTPIKDNDGFSFLPLSLTLEGSLSETMTALARLQKAPFLLSIDQTVLEISEAESQTVSVQVYMRVYVSKSFAEN